MILKLLEQANEVSVTELSKRLKTSEVTIRKDLTTLQNRNLLVRTRGGAIRRPARLLFPPDARRKGSRAVHRIHQQSVNEESNL